MNKTIKTVLIVLGVLFLLGTINTAVQMQKTDTFGPLQTVTLGDLSFQKPSNWQENAGSNANIRVYQPSPINETNKHVSLTVASGFDEIGKSFIQAPEPLQKILLQNLRNSLKVENIIANSPAKHCTNLQYTSFKDITYPNTFLAVESTATCTLNSTASEAVIIAMATKTGKAVIISVTADKTNFDTNRSTINEIMSSVTTN